MQQKKHGSHSSFRPQRDSLLSSLPIGKLLFGLVALFLVVTLFHRPHGADGKPQVPPAAQPLQDETPSPIAQPSAAMYFPAPAPVVGTPEALPLTAPSTAAEPGRAYGREESPPAAETENVDTIAKYVMERDKFGNLIGLGFINGKKVRLLADTGASTVVIPEKMAQALGLKKGAPMPFRTGGGVVVHYATALDTLTLGRIAIHNVQAAINPAMQDDFALLGMNALSLMDMQLEGGNLVLKYKVSESAAQHPAGDEPFKRTTRECAIQGNKFDRESLDCLRGK